MHDHNDPHIICIFFLAKATAFGNISMAEKGFASMTLAQSPN